MSQEAKKPGRRPRSEEGVLSKTMNFRVRASLHSKLRASSEREGRSMGEEIEARLTRSYFLEEMEQHRLGGPEIAILANLFAASVGLIQGATGKKVTDDPETLRGARLAAESVFDAVAAGMFKGVANLEKMKRNLTDAELRSIAAAPVDRAQGYVEVPPKRSLSDIMGR